MKKYLQLLKISLSTSLEYRANLIGLFALHILSILQIVILWVAIFRTNTSVNGFTFESAILYFICVPFIGIITRVSVSDTLSEEIRTGTLSNNLIRPFSIWASKLIETITDKIHNILTLMPIYIVIFTLYYLKVENDQLSISGIMYALFISMCAIALHFALDLAIAHLAFWVVDTWAFQHLKNITFSMVGGFNFPYDILSKNVRIIFEFLPFKFFYYTPISYILGIRSGVTALTQDLLQMILWTMLFIVIASLLWKKGLQKYGAYGM